MVKSYQGEDSSDLSFGGLNVECDVDPEALHVFITSSVMSHLMTCPRYH